MNKNSKTQKLLEENPWIHEHDAFAGIGFGLPTARKVEDELGIIITMSSTEGVSSMKELFHKNLGSARRWGEYPIYFRAAKPQTL